MALGCAFFVALCKSLLEKWRIIAMSNQENALARKFTTFSLLRFAMPTIIMMVFMGLYQVIDAMFISNYVNTDGLSAINIVTPVISFFYGLGAMFATGGSAIIAKKMGEGKDLEAKQNFTALVLIAVTIGIAFALLSTIFMDNLIFTLGGSEQILPYAREYLGILILFAPALLLQILFQNLFVTAGKPNLGLWLMVGAGVTNIVLDYIFMVLLHMGMTGAAIATGIGYSIATIAGIIVFSKRKGTLHFVKPLIKLKEWGQSCYNGSSEMVRELAQGITSAIFNIVMMRLAGEHGVAALAVLIYTQFLFVGVIVGFSMGVSPIVSYQYGAQNKEELRRLLKLCLFWVSLISVLLFIVCQVCAGVMTGFFVPRDSEVYRLAVGGFKIYAFVYLFNGIGMFTSTLFTALSNGKISAILSFTRTFALLTVFLLVFPNIWGITGAWLAPPTAEFLSFILAVALLWKYRNKYFGRNNTSDL